MLVPLCEGFQNSVIENSDGKFGEKKARSLLYDSITKHLNLLRKQRSQELGLHLPEISRDALRKKTQRAEKIYKLLEKIGLDKIQYIKSYSANEISKFTNNEIQKIMDHFSNKPSKILAIKTILLMMILPVKLMYQMFK